MADNKPVIELELYLIRHGQSRGNVGFDNEEVAFTELNDPRLTPLGTMQAKKAGKYLENVEFDACYSSPLVRTVITANEIISFQKEKKTLNVLPLVTEVAVEEVYKGRTIDELREFCDTAVVADGFNEEDGLLFYNPRENEKPIFERAEKAVSYLRSRYKNGEKVLVAGHAAFGTVMIFHIMGYTQSPVYDIEITNTGITHIIFYKEGTNRFGDIVFDSINDTKHFCIPDEDVTDISVSKIIKNNPEDLDDTVKLLVESMKKVNSAKAEDSVDIRLEMTEKTDDIIHAITVDKWQKLRSLVTAAQNTGTALIGDFSTDKAFKNDGEIYFEKSEKEYKGYPVFDLGKLYENLIATSETDRSVIMKKSGFTIETAKRFWKKFIRTYFDGEENDLIIRADDRARLIAYLNIFHSLVKKEDCDKAQYKYYKEKLVEYITRCGSLDFE